MGQSPRHRLSAALLAALFAGCAAPPVTLPRTERHTLHASETGRNYRIEIALPDAPPPAGGYPVLYVLDGNASFATATQLTRALRGLDPAVVVGIGYDTDALFDMDARNEDYTPPAPGLPSQDSRGRREGGADRLLDAIEHRIQPMIAARLAINPRRQALFGHSYGGLFTLHALYTRPALFSHYIAASPSLWWHDRYLQTKLQAYAGQKSPRASVMITVGALEQADAARVGVERAGRLAERAMVDNAQAAANTLAALHSLTVRFEASANEDHIGNLYASLLRAVPFALSSTRDTAR